ncbi:hypothetical protein BD410DRAFT_790719 [Rickenella mellea]|uniref:Uncharacterized protein n=1 Tax=Rickenella mellea TaxID=50990 RepID=A0A4Y7PZA5_9AGAM|nr:hypothetical protein BD410DRAFT_790719 [Rickenella mellea]
MEMPLVFDPEKWSPESIFEFYVREQKTAKSKGAIRTVFRISGDAVVKHVNDESEVNVMKLVLKAKIPTARLLLHVEHGIYSFVVLGYTEGRTLAEAWSSMPLEQKEFVIKTLHDYVVQLRKIKDEHSSTPGPLGPEPLVCDTFQLGYRSQGPFTTYAELTGFLNRKLNLVNRKRPSNPLGPFNEDWPLVLIHNDLNMTNIS